MGIRLIVKDPDPVLRDIAKEVTKFNSNLKKLLKDMAATMYDAGGVGLAAPQIGITKRVIVVDIGDDQGLVEIVNPVIMEQSGEQLGPEGCLSIPNLNGDVKRSDQIVVHGQDSDGQPIIVEGEGYFSRALQHEIDHLNGILFTDLAIRIYDISEIQDSPNKGGE